MPPREADRIDDVLLTLAPGYQAVEVKGVQVFFRCNARTGRRL